MIRVGILGASGYTGGECVRLLQHHPNVTITHLFANRSAGQPTVDSFYSNQLPQQFKTFDTASLKDIDCLLIALPHTTVHPLMKDILKHNVKVVDLSADFRLKSALTYSNYYGQAHEAESLLAQSVYGCPEFYETEIKQSQLVANPGCYAISCILALKPLADKQWLTHATIDAKSGVSGAGKKVAEPYIYCEVNDHVSAYSTNTHRHMAGVCRTMW